MGKTLKIKIASIIRLYRILLMLLVDKILAVKQSNTQDNTSALERQIVMK